MDKKNWLVIAAVLALALLLLTVTRLRPQGNAAAENQVVITVDGKEYARIPLSRPQTVTVTQDNGCVNVVEVTQQGAVMQSSTCGNQLCVKMGEVTVDNWQFRPNQQFIICLPNRVSIELAVTE